MAKKNKFNVDRFDGYVALKDWLVCPDSQTYLAIKGKISILKNIDVVGFDATNREANFFVRVESNDGQKSMNIFGCQIKGIYQGESPKMHQAYQVGSI